ncbi:MAG: SsrA-binding protein [Firmicutes bacterium]|nr:SsrA-binding protein [Bacillota bacterium]
MYVLNMNIAPYEKGNIFNHDPLRTRRLLLHKKEIVKMESKVNEKGYALIPTKLYLHHGMAKLEIALGKGKKNFDKREVEKERDVKRTIDKALKSAKGNE